MLIAPEVEILRLRTGESESPSKKCPEGKDLAS